MSTAQPDSNAELARRCFAALSRGDVSPIEDVLDPEVRWHGGDPDAEGSCRNSRQAMQWIRSAAERLSGSMPELTAVVDAPPDRVVVILQPIGSPTEVANVTRFAGGRVVEIVHFADVAEALASVGLEDEGAPGIS